MNEHTSAGAATAAKVPAITAGFWLLKVLATTLGETGGDTVSMTLGLGYLLGSAIFLGALGVLVVVQTAARRFHPLLYWATIIASTTAGTTLADYADRSLGIGYAGGTMLLLACVLATLALWYRSQGSVAVGSVTTPRTEAFYWATITGSQTLGTALGDWAADAGLGYLGGALVFGAALALVGLLYWRSAVPRVALFWSAFILTRPLGATVGDFFDKPLAEGGLGVSRPLATAVIGVAILAGIWLMPQRAAAAQPSR
ncbi:MAG: hypothetical protein U1F30_14485 [Steroidobacteraceae bacterium]